jgi:DNA-binding response OmpR family regulator
VKDRVWTNNPQTIPGFPDDLRTKDVLTGKELSLLTLLYENQNQIVSKDTVAATLWGTGGEAPTDWAIDKLISRLKAKIVTSSLQPAITTIRKSGYKLVRATV